MGNAGKAGFPASPKLGKTLHDGAGLKTIFGRCLGKVGLTGGAGRRRDGAGWGGDDFLETR
jgi:hypothetical protein